jgi:hypothetical protein
MVLAVSSGGKYSCVPLTAVARCLNHPTIAPLPRKHPAPD